MDNQTGRGARKQFHLSGGVKAERYRAKAVIRASLSRIRTNRLAQSRVPVCYVLAGAPRSQQSA